jgi:hypothetical protein
MEPAARLWQILLREKSIFVENVMTIPRTVDPLIGIAFSRRQRLNADRLAERVRLHRHNEHPRRPVAVDEFGLKNNCPRARTNP